MINTIQNMDYLDFCKKLQDEGVKADLVLTDPPYGRHVDGDYVNKMHKVKKEYNTGWDESPDASDMIDAFSGIIRLNGRSVVFSNGPLTCDIRKYSHESLTPKMKLNNFAIYLKDTTGGVLSCKKTLVYLTEDISIFTNQCDNGTMWQRDYAKKIKEYTGNKTIKEIKKDCGFFFSNFMGVNPVFFAIPSERSYAALTEFYGLDELDWFVPYEQLKQTPTFNIVSGKMNTNVFNYARDNGGFHPTQKPVALMEELIKIYTNPGDLVVDPFAGSCSVAIACINTGRRYICNELDPEFFTKSVERVQNFSKNF